MPRPNQNQRIQALMMLARGDNASTVSRRSVVTETILRLRQRFQQTGGVADRRRPGRPRVTNPQTDRFTKMTHLRRRFQTATSLANRQCCAASGKPGNPFGQGGPMWDKAYSTSSGCPFAVGTTAYPLGAAAVGSGSIL